jgi:sialic acid synthase SpsE
MKMFVGKIREIETALGNPRRLFCQAEKEKRLQLRRSVYLKGKAKAGQKLDDVRVEFRRPGYGIGPDMYEILTAYKFCRDLPEGHMLKFQDLSYEET